MNTILGLMLASSLGSLALAGSLSATEAASEAATQAATGDATDAVARYERVFSGNDATAKKQLLREWSDRSTGDDDMIIPLLVAAIADRQTHDQAVAALRARTGLTPPTRQGQSHYPAYPPSDHPLSWRYWLTDRQRDRTQDARIATAVAHAQAALDAANDAAAAVEAMPAPTDTSSN